MKLFGKRSKTRRRKNQPLATARTESHTPGTEHSSLPSGLPISSFSFEPSDGEEQRAGQCSVCERLVLGTVVFNHTTQARGSVVHSRTLLCDRCQRDAKPNGASAFLDVAGNDDEEE
jgi:hypothetical protein